MKKIWNRLFVHASLHGDELQLYRNFNFLLLFAIADISIILVSLRTLQPEWPFYTCLLELVAFCCFLFFHINGHFQLTRYLTFLFTMSMQALASYTHGASAGFEYLFFPLMILPMLFFSRHVAYVSLFLVGMFSLLLIKFSYTLTTPLIVIEGRGMFYWNVTITCLAIYLIMFFFKKSYLKGKKALEEKNREILLQKEEIESMNGNLEQIIRERTERIKSHEHRFVQFAFINAHKVRGPLARILGLLNIIELENDKAKALEEHYPSLRANTDELNEVLKEVSQSLNEIDEKE